MNIPEILLLLFIVNLGIAFGGGLYETRIVLPLWFGKLANGSYEANGEAMRNIDTGRKFWGFVTTVPLTLITITNLVFAFRAPSPSHGWWLVAAVIILFERIGTFVFFIPSAIRLQHSERFPPAKTSRMILWWMRMNYLRNALTFAGLLLALKTLLVI
jgi:hypothetical protein